jgi:hypothetical protein
VILNVWCACGSEGITPDVEGQVGPVKQMEELKKKVCAVPAPLVVPRVCT